MKVKYKIGDFVLVHVTVEAGYNDNKERQLYQTVYKEPFVAQITGAIHRQLGKWIKGDYEESSYLKCSGTILVWKVRRGITNSEIDVLDSDIELLTEQQKLPWRYINWTKKDREYARENALFSPRDSRGRFRRIK